MATIKRLTGAAIGKGYNNLTDYATDWRIMFSNARVYNIEESQIYEDSTTLEEVFEVALVAAAAGHGLQLELDADNV